MIIYKGKKAYYEDKSGKIYKIYEGEYGIHYITVNNMNMTIDIHKVEKINNK